MSYLFKSASPRLMSVALLAAASLALAACSDEKKAETAAPAAKTETAQSAPAATTPAQPAVSHETTASTTPVELPKSEGEVELAKLMAPGPLPEVSLGKDDAKVTIVEYMSMTCPHCARFHNSVFEEIKQKYVDSGKVKFILREFPLDNRAAAAIMLARCAPKEQYFPMVSALFKSQMTWATAEDGRAALLQMAKLAGFSEQSFEACLTNQKLLDEVNATREKASKDFGVDSTPTFFINGKRYAGEMSVAEMSALIDAAE
ncbi:DsbA family protein [Rhizobium sp. TRM95796]|uniref:DsbA family protein n=1 Tax=Rhizobium sp. TRM95796 TaxID=2979862 RepID=UPI0021E818F9|nr:thioredoxin domain-containing protein [Rhizobium sp. TRM95796]MCV3766448.1 thioredoxin domain-containing protein [Rhizobium sp. TRM95796]